MVRLDVEHRVEVAERFLVAAEHALDAAEVEPRELAAAATCRPPSRGACAPRRRPRACRRRRRTAPSRAARCSRRCSGTSSTAFFSSSTAASGLSLASARLARSAASAASSGWSSCGNRRLQCCARASVGARASRRRPDRAASACATRRSRACCVERARASAQRLRRAATATTGVARGRRSAELRWRARDDRRVARRRACRGRVGGVALRLAAMSGSTCRRREDRAAPHATSAVDRGAASCADRYRGAGPRARGC